MKKWLLAVMICLSFASLTAGLFLLPKYIDIFQSQNQKPEEDLPVHGSSHLYGQVYKYVANAQTGTTEIASGGGSIRIEHTDQNARYVNGTTYEAAASETVNGVKTSGGDGHWEDKRGFNVIVTPSYGFYVSKIQIGDDTSWYNSSQTSTTTKTYDQSGLGWYGEVTKNIYIDFGRRTTTVTFNVNGGTAGVGTTTSYGGYGYYVPDKTSNSSESIRFGQKVYYDSVGGAHTGFSKTGYTFSSVSFSRSGSKGTEYSGANTVYYFYLTSYYSTLTCTVNWTANRYAITLLPNGSTGGTTSTQTVYAQYDSSTLYSSSSGSTAASITNPTKTGYTFGGWATSGGTNQTGTVIINTSKALTASNGYTNSSKQWTSTNTLTVYAKWTANRYAITLNVNGATGGMTSNKTIYAQYDSSTLYSSSSGSTTASWTNPTWNGYTFGGWVTSSGINQTGTVIINTSKALTASNGYTNSSKRWTSTSTLTVYAKWTPISYTITYNAGGGSFASGVSSTQTYTTVAGKTLYSSTSVTRTGYTFSNWKASNANGSWTNGTTYGANTHLDGEYGNVTLTAQWNINSYTLTAYANSGSISSTSGWSGTGSSTSKTLNYAAAYSTLPTVSRSNYNLKGWYTESSGGSAVSSTTTIGAGNANIYAQWTAISKTITLNGRVVGKDGNVVNSDNLGGSILTGTYTSVSDGATGSGTINQSANTYGYTMHQGSTLTITPTVASGYKYLGYSTSASTKPSVSSFPTSSSITVPTSNTTYYFYFQEVAAPLYYTTERGGYWYYEDGEYPQTYIGPTLSGTSATSSKFNINGTDYTVYTANGLKYIQVESPMTGSIKLNNGTTVSLTKGTKYWFRIDPIRWRVSEYGAAANKYSLASVTSNLMGISDVLGYGRINTTTSTFTKKDLKSEEMSAYTQSCSAVGYTNASTNMTYTFDKLIGDGSSSKTTTYTKSLAQANTLTVASLADIQTAAHNGTAQENLQTYASDMSAMLQCRDYNNSTGWTSSIYNIGSGIVVGPGSGTRGAYWSDETNKFGFVFAHQASYATCLGTR